MSSARRLRQPPALRPPVSAGAVAAVGLSARASGWARQLRTASAVRLPAEVHREPEHGDEPSQRGRRAPADHDRPEPPADEQARPRAAAPPASAPARTARTRHAATAFATPSSTFFAALPRAKCPASSPAAARAARSRRRRRSSRRTPRRARPRRPAILSRAGGAARRRRPPWQQDRQGRPGDQPRHHELERLRRREQQQRAARRAPGDRGDASHRSRARLPVQLRPGARDGPGAGEHQETLLVTFAVTGGSRSPAAPDS